MGHDIFATHNNKEIAYNRRSAGNPLNQVLYLALGCMDETYAGCSGNGKTLKITLNQFLSAKNVLENKSFENMEIDRNLSHDILDALKSFGMKVVMGNSTPDDINQEKTFIGQCIEYMQQNKIDSIDVHFG